jgi:hypothetical protein
MRRPLPRRARWRISCEFPAASPLLFQTSIHPGGVQQVLIGRQQPVARLWPLAGRRAGRAGAADRAARTGPRVALAGGEERGTWMLEHHMASARSFAFAAVLTREPAGAAGRVAFTPGPARTSRPGRVRAWAGCPDPGGPFAAGPRPTDRRPLHWRGAGGAWALDWS